jgi:two-component system phosphate regulon sensor histidine kinase PhoR
MRPTLDRSRSTWRWIFVLLIAAPALSLAALGLRTVRLDRVEWEQQLRERQVQTARLVDAEIGARLSDLEVGLQIAPLSPSWPSVPSPASRRLFSLDSDGTVTFLRERVYFPDPAKSAHAVSVQPSVATAAMIVEAQEAEARGKYDDARRLLQRIATATPALADWARWAAARLRHAGGDAMALRALASVDWSASDERTPNGLPVALIAGAYVGRLAPGEQARCRPLLAESLRALRSGRWLLSFAERSFYDGELQRLLKDVDGEQAATGPLDPQLADLAALEPVLRRATPGQRVAVGRTGDGPEGKATLLLWSRSDSSDADRWVGMALSNVEIRALIDGAVGPLLAPDTFTVAFRDAAGHRTWQQAPGEFVPVYVHSLRSIPGWDLSFSKPRDPAGLSQRRVLWFGLILVLVSMLGAGLWMTVRTRQEELALARRQSEFVAAVSHEFKSPLTSIRLYMERLASGRAGLTESADYYLAVEQETARLERLVNRLLDSQQSQEGLKTYALQRASISEAAQLAIDRLQRQAEAKGVRLELRAHDDRAELLCDSGAVADAIENLVENAIKYSPEGSVVAIATTADPNAVRVDVQDQGIGIDAQDLPRIFDKFFRGRRGDAADVRGTGLGLSLVKAIVDGHGGSIAVTSTPGSGSCFSVTLPRRHDASSEATS